MHGCLWLIHADVWQRPTQYCKALILQLKKTEKKKKRERESAGRTQVCTQTVSSLRAGGLNASGASMVPEREQDSINSNKTSPSPSSRVLRGSLRNRGNDPFLFCSFFLKKIVLFFLARLICQTRLISLPSIWVTEPEVQRCH